MTEAEIGVMSFEEEEGARSQGIHKEPGHPWGFEVPKIPHQRFPILAQRH